MRAFRFRLEQVQRWRETQVDLQKGRLAAAAGRVVKLEADIEASKAALLDAQHGVAQEAAATFLQSFAAFSAATTARIRETEAQLGIARRNRAVEMNRLVEADRRARLLEKLKERDLGEWHRDFERQLATFTDEMFLNGCR